MRRKASAPEDKGLTGRILLFSKQLQLVVVLFCVTPGLVIAGKKPPVSPPADPRIVFVDANKLVVMNEDGTNQTVVFTASMSQGSILQPRFSPDRKKVVFTASGQAGGADTTYLLDISLSAAGVPVGSAARVLFDSGVKGSYPMATWSPGGDWLAISMGFDVDGYRKNNIWLIPTTPWDECPDPMGGTEDTSDDGPLSAGDLTGCGVLVNSWKGAESEQGPGRFVQLGGWSSDGSMLLLNDHWAAPLDSSANHDYSTCGGWSSLEIFDLGTETLTEIARFPHHDFLGVEVHEWLGTTLIGMAHTGPTADPPDSDWTVKFDITDLTGGPSDGPIVFTQPSDFLTPPYFVSEGGWPSLSPDGAEVVLSVFGRRSWAIWKQSLQDGTSTRMTNSGHSAHWAK